MRGRITQVELPMAEESIPGITAFRGKERKKSRTFLELLWAFEGVRRTRRKAPLGGKSNDRRQRV